MVGFFESKSKIFSLIFDSKVNRVVVIKVFSSGKFLNRVVIGFLFEAIILSRLKEFL